MYVKSLLKTCGNVKFHIQTTEKKKRQVIKLFFVRRKQENASQNNFTTQTCVKIHFDHVFNAKARQRVNNAIKNEQQLQKASKFFL